MRTMLVFEFKAKCIATLKEVQRTRRPIMITLRGKPLAAVQPVFDRAHKKRLGGLKGRMVIRRDLLRVDTTKDWEMLRPLTHEIAQEAYALPGAFHQDPADRILVAAARVHGVTLLTGDDRILAYQDVRSLDART